MKLFKLIASRAGQVLFDDRVEAESPREAREQMKALLGMSSLTGVVYAITEIPVDLIQSILDARLAEEAVREQLASLRHAQAAELAAAAPQEPPQRFDPFTTGGQEEPSPSARVTPAPLAALHGGRPHRGLAGGEAGLPPHRFVEADGGAVRAVGELREGALPPGGLDP